MSHSETLTLSTSGNNGLSARCLITITDDAANNRSSIGVTYQCLKTNGFTSQGNVSGNIVIAGNNFPLSGNKTISTSSWTTIGSASLWVAHDSAGVRASLSGIGVSGAALAGSSDYDTPVSGTTTLESANFTNYVRLPGTPGLPVASLLTSTSVKFSWTASSSPVSPVQYGQYLGLDAAYGSYAVPSSWLSAGVLEYSYSGLSRGTNYWFRTRALTSEGQSGYTTSVPITTPHTKPDQPVAPTVGSITQTTATINTTDPAYVGAGVTARQTELRLGTTVVNTYTTVDPALTGLNRNSTYSTRYRVQNAIGWSDWSAYTYFQTPGAPPSAPTSYIVYEIASTSAKITTGTIADNGGVAPSQMRVKISTTASDAGLVTTITVPIWATMWLYGLLEGTNYYAAEAAYNTASGGGWGPYGAWVAFTTLNTVPNAPLLSLDAASGTTATLEWTVPSDLNGATISNYQVRVSTNQAITANVRSFTVAAGVLSLVVDALTAGTNYWATIWTNSDHGAGSSSAPYSFATTGGGSGSGVWIDVAGVPKFAQVWLDVAGVPKLCEVWVDVAGTPKLCVT